MNSATTAALPVRINPASSRPRLHKKPGPSTAIVFVDLLAVGLLFTGYGLVSDVNAAGPGPATTWVPHSGDRARAGHDGGLEAHPHHDG